MFGRILILVAVAVVAWAVLARTSNGAGHTQVYVVKPTDTLWTISAAHYGGDPREGIWQIEQRNRLHGPTIVPGQRLLLP